MPLHAGDTVHKIYRVLAKLRQGGFGVLYLAYDVAQERLVVIKESRASEEAQHALQAEIDLLQAIRHTSLVLIYEHFVTDDGTLCFAMEFIPGDTLDSYVKRGELPPIDTAVAWIAQVLEALSALHLADQPIIHHDVKLSNIQIHGVTNRAYLLDLGVARSGPYTTIPPFSAPFAPPEQYEQGRTTPATDIYAVGVCLYILLTGETPPESLARQRHDTLTAPRTINPQLTRKLEDVILRALHLDSTHRYPNAPAMLEALHQAYQAPRNRSRPAVSPRDLERVQAVLARQRQQLRLVRRQQVVFQRLLARRRKLVRAGLVREQRYKRLLVRRRKLVRAGLERDRAHWRQMTRVLAREQRYKRLLARRRKLVVAGLARERTLRDAHVPVAPHAPLDAVWTHHRTKTFGLALIVISLVGLLISPGNVQLITIIILTLGCYPLLALGAAAVVELRTSRWRLHNDEPLARLFACLIYSALIGSIVLSLLRMTFANPWTYLGISGLIVLFGVIVGGLLCGTLARQPFGCSAVEATQQ